VPKFPNISKENVGLTKSLVGVGCLSYVPEAYFPIRQIKKTHTVTTPIYAADLLY